MAEESYKCTICLNPAPDEEQHAMNHFNEDGSGPITIPLCSSVCNDMYNCLRDEQRMFQGIDFHHPEEVDSYVNAYYDDYIAMGKKVGIELDWPERKIQSELYCKKNN